MVSDELLDREHFLPARSLNLIAAAWIQFQVHDWVNHKRHRLGEHDVKVPLPQGGTIRIADNEARSVDSDGTKRLFANAVTHWWDASEVYGADDDKTRTCGGTDRGSG